MVGPTSSPPLDNEDGSSLRIQSPWFEGNNNATLDWVLLGKSDQIKNLVEPDLILMDKTGISGTVVHNILWQF